MISEELIGMLMDDYERIRIKPIRITSHRNEFLVEFENGDFWRACAARESARGLKTNMLFRGKTL